MNKNLKFLKAFNYAGIKDFLIPNINLLISDYNLKYYIEPFIGSGAIFYNINKSFNKYIINDLDKNIFLMHNAIKKYSYKEYKNKVNYVLNTFGDIKSNKEAYYNFRNFYNIEYYNKDNDIAGLFLIQLANSCINSMLRFSKNGMNQSYGNRHYIITEDVYNKLHEKLQNTIITNYSYEKIINLNVKYNDCLLFLDPPYEFKEMTYNNNFHLNSFIDILKSIKGANTIICYTDVESVLSDTLLNYGFDKQIIRQMKNISPNRKEEIITNEIMYFKYLNN